MRILLLDNSHLPHVGGKEIVVHHLATQYQKLGHSVRMAGAGSYRAHRHLDFGYPVQRFMKLPLLNKEYQWQLRMRRIMRNDPFDVVHAHTTHPSGYHIARHMLASGKPVPLIITPHGADIHKVPEVNFGKRLDKGLDEKIRWALQNCNYATAISESVRESLLDADMPEKGIVSISNGVDEERLSKPGGTDAREFYNIPADAPYFVSVGNYHPRKGHETLVTALQKCKEKKSYLFIVGRKSQAFVDRVNAMPDRNRVIFTGALAYPVPGLAHGPDIIASLLQQSTGYISASMGEGTEGLSLALLEAMATGTGIIATSVSGNRDIIENGKNGLLIKPGRDDDMAAAMDRLVSDTELRDTMGRNAKTTVAPFTWDAVARQYVALFERAIEETSQAKTRLA